jgi:hypothetical protein
MKSEGSGVRFVNFVLNASLTSTYNLGFDGPTRQVMRVLIKDSKNDSFQRAISCHWLLKPSVEYYNHSENFIEEESKHIDFEIRRLEQTESEPDYIYTTEETYLENFKEFQSAISPPNFVYKSSITRFDAN